VSKIFLIHGYGTGITNSVFGREFSFGQDRGFGAFNSAVEAGQAYAIDWSIKQTIGLFGSINPLSQLSLYFRERNLARRKETHLKLKNELYVQNPETIICHSMGTFLLLNMLSHHDLPASVKHLVFVQADIGFLRSLPTNVSPEIRVTNYFCPWDQALWSSTLLNLNPRAGLFGLTKKGRIINKFWPLYRKLNLHTSSINDPKFAKLFDN
jgi:hypothetical protein